MIQTIPLICKTQEDYEKLLLDGYELKEGNEIKYLRKNG